MTTDDKIRELHQKVWLQEAAMDVLLRAVDEAYGALEMARFHTGTRAAGIATKCTDEGVEELAGRASFRLRAAAKVACAATGWDYQRAVDRQLPWLRRERRKLSNA